MGHPISLPIQLVIGEMTILTRHGPLVGRSCHLFFNQLMKAAVRVGVICRIPLLKDLIPFLVGK